MASEGSWITLQNLFLFFFLGEIETAYIEISKESRKQLKNVSQKLTHFDYMSFKGHSL